MSLEPRMKAILEGIELRTKMYGSELETIEMQYLMILQLLYPTNFRESYDKFAEANNYGNLLANSHCTSMEELVEKLIEFKTEFLLKTKL